MDGSSIEEIAEFLNVGRNYIYQIRSDITAKNPSAKMLRKLLDYQPLPKSSQVSTAATEMKDAATPYGQSALFFEVRMKDTVVRIPVPNEPGGREKAVAAAREMAARPLEIKPAEEAKAGPSVYAKGAGDDVIRLSSDEARKKAGGNGASGS